MTDRMSQLVDLLRSMTYRELMDFSAGIEGDADKIDEWAEDEADKVLRPKK